MIGKRSSSEAPDEWAGGHSRFPACWRRCADCGGHQTAIGPLKSRGGWQASSGSLPLRRRCRRQGGSTILWCACQLVSLVLKGYLGAGRNPLFTAHEAKERPGNQSNGEESDARVSS